MDEFLSASTPLGPHDSKLPSGRICRPDIHLCLAVERIGVDDGTFAAAGLDCCSGLLGIEIDDYRCCGIFHFGRPPRISNAVACSDSRFRSVIDLDTGLHREQHHLAWKQI